MLGHLCISFAVIEYGPNEENIGRFQTKKLWVYKRRPMPDMMLLMMTVFCQKSS